MNRMVIEVYIYPHFSPLMLKAVESSVLKDNSSVGGSTSMSKYISFALT